MVVRHDDLEAERLRLCDLVDCGDPAVDREDEADTLSRETGERLARDAVALFEPTREMPHHVRVELAEEENCERGRADAVHVVVAVDADPLPGCDSSADAFHGNGHVAQQQRVVPGQLGVQEPARRCRIGVAAANEDGRRDVAQTELTSERVGRRSVERRDGPDTRHHG